MATRLALVNCKGPTEGPWTIAKGNESGLEIFALGEGSLIRFDCEVDGLTKTYDFNKPGEHPLPKLDITRYRVSKVGDSNLATIVRIILNGKS